MRGLALPCRTKLWPLTSMCVCGGIHDHHRETVALVQRGLSFWNESKILFYKCICTWASGMLLKVAKLSKPSLVRNTHHPKPLLCHKTKEARSPLFSLMLSLESVFIYLRHRHFHLIEQRAWKFSFLIKCSINHRCHGFVYNIMMTCFKPTKCMKFHIYKQIEKLRQYTNTCFTRRVAIINFKLLSSLRAIIHYNFLFK